jgi:hypothetical protein
VIPIVSPKPGMIDRRRRKMPPAIGMACRVIADNATTAAAPATA